MLPIGVATQQTYAVSPVLETHTTYNSGGSLLTSFSINKPAGVVSGDLLLCFMGGTNGITDWNQATGWVMEQEYVGVGDGNCCQSRVADGTEGATLGPFSATSSGGRLVAACLRISGVAETPINDKSLRWVEPPSGTENCTGITTTVGSCLGISCIWLALNTSTKPDVTFNTTDWVQVTDFSGGSFTSMAVGTNPNLGGAGAKACQLGISGGSPSRAGLHFLAIAG